MCGIAALLGRAEPRLARASLQAMVSAQAHRGPDDEGIEILEVGETVVGLGSRRLAVRDLSNAGHQPMRDPSTDNVLAYNGELYNTEELRRELSSRGHSFRSLSDTEVVLHAYQEWGTGSFGRLRGMWALAVWDRRRQQLVVARDHLGIKPLYVGRTPDGMLLCSSEVRALAASGLLVPTVDRAALAGYLAYGSVLEPRTLLEGVEAVAPGSWAAFGISGHRQDAGRHWTLPVPDRVTSRRQPEVMRECRWQLEQAVKRHLVADVPVAVFLSSGLDSTAVAALAQATHEGEVHTFTVSFPETPDADEAALASRVADRLRTVHTQCVIDRSTALEWIQGALTAMDQPSADGVNTYLVSRAAHEAGIVVALSGQGGDELFGGYDSFGWVDRWTPRLAALGRLVPARGRAGLAWVASARRTNIRRAKTVDLAAAHPDVISLYLAYKRELSNSHLRHLGVELSSLQSLAGAVFSSDLGTVVDGDRLAAVRLLEIQLYLTNTLLRDGDVFGMANSIEIRVPFLDQGLVEFVCSLPGPVFMPPGQRAKWLLRQSCADLYDPEQLALPKRGFVLPLGLWMLGPLAEVVDESLETLCASALVDPAGVRRVRQHYLQAPGSLAWTRLWTLVVLGHWLTVLRQVAREAAARLPSMA